MILGQSFFFFLLHCVSLAARGLFLVAAGKSSSPGAVLGLFIVVAFLVAEHRLYYTGSVVAAHRLSCPKACGILVPRRGIKPMSSALAGGFLTPGPPGNSQGHFLILNSHKQSISWGSVGFTPSFGFSIWSWFNWGLSGCYDYSGWDFCRAGHFINGVLACEVTSQLSQPWGWWLG